MEELKVFEKLPLERLILSLEGKLVMANAKIIRQTHDTVALAIVPLNDSYNRTLLKYISSSLSHA